MSPDVSRLPSARETVRALLRDCSIDERDSYDILLSVQEALKNAVRFSGSEKEIEIDLSVTERSVSVVVRDHGRGFDGELLRGSPFLAPDPLSPAGRGLFLITHLMDEVRLGSDGGAEVRMLKRLPPH